jgi:para-nitrobenzyl esterase
VYEFAWPSPQFDGRLGSCHALEIAFVFDLLAAPENQPLAGDAPPQRLADEMHRAWVSFVCTGDPGWAPYDPASRPVQVFDEPSALVADPRPEQLAVWAGVR